MTIRIERIEATRISYAVAGHFKFFEQPRGGPPARPTLVIKVTDNEGMVGWGQCVPSPRWSYETLETAQTTIDTYLAPELIGCDPFDVPVLHALMNRAIAGSFSTGQPLAKAGLDLALFDLTGRRLGQSAAQRWGRRGRSAVALSWTLNPQSLDEIGAQIALAASRGYRSFNVKIAPDAKFDLELCRQVRQLVPDAFVWVDANGGYDEPTARAVAPRFADLGIAALEQPLPANCLAGYQRLKRQHALPILMDEGIVCRADLEAFLHFDLLDGVAMKVSRCGGLTEAYRVLELVEQAGLLFFGSGLTDPDLSLAASLALFGAFNLRHPAALNGPQYITCSFLRRPLTVVDGHIVVPVGPGLGVEVDEERMRHANQPRRS